MEYKKFGNTFGVRLDPGEEVMSSLESLARKENIRLAIVNGIGATNEVVLGVFDADEKKYHSTMLDGNFEITGLSGNINRMNGEIYIHLHMSIGNPEEKKCYSGHMNRCVISATAEIFVTVLDGDLDREFSQEIGLNILKF